MTTARPSTPPDARETAARFALGDPAGPAVLSARGELGRIWRMPTTRGVWALKEVFDPSPTARDDAYRDLRFQEAALAGGIPMPRPIVAPDGAVLIEVGPDDDRRTVRVYTWVDLQGHEVAAPISEVAAILGRLHAIAPATDRPVEAWFGMPPPAAELDLLLERARSVDVPWADALAGLVRVIAEATAAVGRPAATPEGRVTCHLDYNPDNVLLDAAGRTCVVDWENSGPAEPVQELASAVAQFARTPDLVAPFLEAYASAGGPARLRDRHSFAMTVIVDANLVATYARRALDAPDPEDRARAAFWIGDIAANAFTIDRIDGWLEAARAAGFA